MHFIFQATLIRRQHDAWKAEWENSYILNIEKRFPPEKRATALADWIDNLSQQFPKPEPYLAGKIEYLTDKLDDLIGFSRQIRRAEDAARAKYEVGHPGNYTYFVRGGRNYPIEVKGDKLYHVRRALDLLNTFAPQELEFIATHLKGIEVSQDHVNVFSGSSKIFKIGTALYCMVYSGEPYKLAGDIAHEAGHGYNRDMGLYQGNDGENRQQNELTSYEYAWKVLKKIGAPEEYLDYIRALDGCHWDENNDGIFSEEDATIRRERILRQNKLFKL